MILSKQQILEANDLRRETIHVKEWGGDVIVRTMTGTERDAWEQSMVGEDRKPSMENARAKLVSRCVVDEAGNLLFTDEDIEALGKKSARALQRLSKAAERVNGLGEKEIEEARGN